MSVATDSRSLWSLLADAGFRRVGACARSAGVATRNLDRYVNGESPCRPYSWWAGRLGAVLFPGMELRERTSRVYAAIDRSRADYLAWLGKSASEQAADVEARREHRRKYRHET